MGGYRYTDPATSRMAFEQMKSDGSLSSRRLEIASFFACHDGPPPTAGQIASHLKSNRNNVATRLSEMEHLGVVRKHSEVTCPISKKLCWTWEMTGRQPSGSIPRGGSRIMLYKNLLIEACAALEETQDMFACAKAKEIWGKLK